MRITRENGKSRYFCRQRWFFSVAPAAAAWAAAKESTQGLGELLTLSHPFAGVRAPRGSRNVPQAARGGTGPPRNARAALQARPGSPSAMSSGQGAAVPFPAADGG